MAWAFKTTHAIQGVVHRVSEGVMWLGASVLVVNTLLIVSDAFGRYFLKSPIVGTMEIVELLLSIIAFSGMVYVTAREGNVRVVLLVKRFSGRVQRILAFIMTSIGAGAFALVSWRLWLSAMEWARLGRQTPALGIPLPPFKFAAAVAAGLICLTLLISLLSSRGKQE